MMVSVLSKTLKSTISSSSRPIFHIRRSSHAFSIGKNGCCSSVSPLLYSVKLRGNNMTVTDYPEAVSNNCPIRNYLSAPTCV